jgi:cytochrome c-type biogenesis protein CcmH
MQPTGVDWFSSLVVVGVALALGAFLVWRVFASGRREPPAPTAAPLELRDLEGKRDGLFQQLRELEDAAAKRSPEQLARERYALELSAAEVLRDLARRQAAVAVEAKRAKPKRSGKAVAEPATSGWLQSNPALKGFLWGAGSIAAMGLLFYLVSQSATERGPAGSVTGNTPMGESGGSETATEEAELKAVLARDPDDLEARLALARVYLARQDMMGVWNETNYVLERTPGEPRALSYQSLVRLAMGQPEVALDMLKQALATSPDLFDAYIHMSLVYARLGRLEDGEATIQEAIQRFPDQQDLLERLWREMRQADLAPDAAPATGSADAPATAESVPAPQPRMPAADRGLAGVLELDPSLSSTSLVDAVVFVTVRAAGGEGPPLAVNRLARPSFPMAFEISSAHSMMGEPLPDRVSIEARLDADANPTTRDPGEPEARLDDVAAGSTGLRLVLRR